MKRAPDDNGTLRSQGLYVVAARRDNLIYVSGMTPRKNGLMLQPGQIDPDQELDLYREVVRQAARNALTAASTQVKESEAICEVLSLIVYVNAPTGFSKHSCIADFASEFFQESFGDNGLGVRAAIGVSSLPSNAPVELQVIVGVCGT